MKANVRIKGLKKISRKIEAMRREAGDETASGLRILGEMVMTDVKNARPGAGVPKKTGNLMRSGDVTGPDTEDVVRLTFGGSAAPYALVQHERKDYAHKLGEARYLIRGLERAAAGNLPEEALQEVADEVVRIGKATQ